jgi:hypothetical protein
MKIKAVLARTPAMRADFAHATRGFRQSQKISAALISSPAPAGSPRPGIDAPYTNYELGKPYDEMFSRDGKARLPYAVMDSRISTLPLEELNRRHKPASRASCIRHHLHGL